MSAQWGHEKMESPRMRIDLLKRRGLTVPLLAALALILLLAGAPPGRAQDEDAVSTVNGDTITRADFHARLRFVRWQYLKELEKLYEATAGSLGLTQEYVQSRLDLLADPAALGDAVLAQMEEERLLWQTGEKLDVTPTAEEAAAREDAFFGLWTGVAPDAIAADAAAQEFIARWFADASAASGMSEDDLHEVFATEALRDKLQDYLGRSLPIEEPAVHTRHILCSFHPERVTDTTPPDAAQRAAADACIQAAQQRLAAGEDFAAIARDLSADQSSGVNGGDLGWVLVSYLTPAYADAVEGADLNTVIGPVETEYGLHLIEVLGRRQQALTEAELAESRQGYFDLWVSALRDAATLERAADWDADLPADPGLDTLAPEVQDAIRAFEEAGQGSQ